MAFEDDMIDAGFNDEESYLEYLFDEDERRMERQRQRREEEEEEERFLNTLSEEEQEAYAEAKLQAALEEREERERRLHRQILEREKELYQERIKKEIRDAKLKELRTLKEQWTQDNSTDVLIWNELEKQEDKHAYFYDELTFLQKWYGWILCRKEFREWKANNMDTDTYIKCETAFENLRNKGYSTKEEFEEFTCYYILDKLSLTKNFDYQEDLNFFGDLDFFDYHKRVQQFNIWRTENEDEWHSVLEELLDRNPDFDFGYISLSSDKFINFLVLNDNRYSLEKVVGLLDHNDYCNYSGRIKKLTEWEELYLRKKYFPEYYNDIIRNIQTYIRTLNEMSVFSHYQRYNPDFLQWLMSHKELDIAQDWIDTLKYESDPINKGSFNLYDIDDIDDSYSNIDLSCVFMGLCGLSCNYMQLGFLVNKTSNTELLSIWKEEGEFLKEYNDWLYYIYHIDKTGQYENFFERLHQNKLLQI